MRNSGKVSNYGRIISVNRRQRLKLFMLYLKAKSFNRQLQLLAKLRVKVYVSRILNHHH
jgi:hypothetical protein